VVEGPVVTVLAGFLVYAGQLNAGLAYLVIVAGDLTGDLLYYLAGTAGKRAVARFGRIVGMQTRHIETLEKHYQKHPGKTLIIGKLAHGLGGPILAAAGLARMPLDSFIFYNVAATIPKSLLLMALGYFSGRAYFQVNQYLNTV